MSKAEYFELAVNAAIKAAPLMYSNSRIIPKNQQGQSNIVSVHSPRQLHQLIEVAHKIIGINSSERDIADTVRHESQHAAAVKAMGERAMYGVRFGLTTEYFVGMQASVEQSPLILQPDGKPERLSLLKHMAAIAHPEWLSAGDTLNLENYGYDIDRVGFEATAHNQQGDDYIPAPMSYRPSTAVIIS